nr:MAG TPA: hypothetical protein [Caudoviricetes sp.]
MNFIGKQKAVAIYAAYKMIVVRSAKSFVLILRIGDRVYYGLDGHDAHPFKRMSNNRCSGGTVYCYLVSTAKLTRLPQCAKHFLGI